MEIPRVYALCLLVAALAAFPRGRRNRTFLPLEIVVVIIAFVDRVVTNQIKLFNIHGLSGVVFLLVVTLIYAIWCVLCRRLPHFRERPA
jgi:uncharacterized membrane protein YhaH (DUF805 family)